MGYAMGSGGTSHAIIHSNVYRHGIDASGTITARFVCKVDECSVGPCFLLMQLENLGHVLPFLCIDSITSLVITLPW
jgi:hypothetical protein